MESVVSFGTKYERPPVSAGGRKGDGMPPVTSIQTRRVVITIGTGSDAVVVIVPEL
jgi:hypothetical protein